MRSVVLLLAALLAPAVPLHAQLADIRDGAARGGDSLTNVSTSRRAQANFESFRRLNIPTVIIKRGAGGGCDEQVGRFCYWYDESAPDAPPEPEAIRAARARLVALLDTAARANRADPWIAGQLVRYLDESGRGADALAAARACAAEKWWCEALQGFAHHQLGQYPAADSAYARALAAMEPRERCAWRDISLLLDDAQQQQYRKLSCAERVAFEDRVWWLARPLLSSRGNDARTEFYARMTMSHVLDDAPSAHQMGFDKDERELLLRYSWPRAWARDRNAPRPREDDRGITDSTVSIVSHEPSPAAPYLPVSFVTDNPANSDSVRWRSGSPPIRARYAPAFATPMRRLDHQAAMFRRGDSARVVLAYDAARDAAFRGTPVDAALVLTRGDERASWIARAGDRAARGVLMATAPWGPLLLSAEAAATERRAAARARYGIRPPYALGVRVSLSDMLLFAPGATLPTTVEEAAARALPTLRLRAAGKVGFFWETYGTDPAGEPISVSLTVGREDEDEPGWWKRKLMALKLAKDTRPVTVGFRDITARGTSTTPRALLVDLSTLKPGLYTVQLEVEVANQYTVRTERMIEIVP